MKGLHWDITRKCNLRCQHCYNADKYFNVGELDYSNGELTLSECFKVVDKIHEAGFRRIHFLGGEPLASPYIFDVIAYAKKYNFIISINSNATLLNDKTQNKLIDLGVDQFSASLDGATPDTNDKIRGTGVFKSVVENINSLNKKIRLQKSHMQTAIVSAITKSNYKEAFMMPQLAEKIGCNLLCLALFIESGNGKHNIQQFQIDMNEILSEIEKTVANMLSTKIYLQLDLRPLIAEYFKHKYNKKIIHNIGNDLCLAGEDIWYLEADGLVHPCLAYRMNYGKSSIKSGTLIYEKTEFLKNEVKDIELGKYWKSFLNQKQQFKKENLSSCIGCQFFNVCSPCPFEYNHYDHPVPECLWVQERITADVRQIKNSYIKQTGQISIENNYFVINGLRIDYSPILNDILNSLSKSKMTTFSDLVSNIIDIYNVDQKTIEIDLMLLIYQLININAIEIENNNSLNKETR